MCFDYLRCAWRQPVLPVPYSGCDCWCTAGRYSAYFPSFVTGRSICGRTAGHRLCCGLAACATGMIRLPFATGYGSFTSSRFSPRPPGTA